MKKYSEVQLNDKKENIFIEKFIQYGMQNYNEIDNDELSGDRSWEHCHKIFRDYRGQTLTEESKDLLCLHLAWYLASWGMLRNSFLRNYSYQIHEKAVEEIYNPKWESLWDIDFSEVWTENHAELIMKLSYKLKEIYKDYLKNSNAGITDTLQTKILLGTIGCVPAYDTYLKNALKNTGIAPTTYGKKSLIKLSEFYADNKDKFGELQNSCSQRVDYPSAKILDMCLFQYGYYSSKVESIAASYLKETDNFDCQKKDYAAYKRQLCLSVIHGCDKVKENNLQEKPVTFELENSVKWIRNKLNSEENKKYRKYFTKNSDEACQD